MSTLVPSASSCHSLRLPPTEKDDRLNLNVRTGSASTLYKSLVFTYGGLTIGLDIEDENINDLLQIFHLKISNLKSSLIDRYLSGEFFYLDLIEKYWTRVDIPNDELKPNPRVFHEITAVNNCVYVFGGLVVNEKCDSYTHEVSNERELVPCNDLWEFSLETRKWILLHDGSNYESDAAIPNPRYSHKMTTLSSLSFANKKDHFGIFIAGGRDHESKSLYDNYVFDLVTKEYVGSSPIELILETKKNNQRYRNVDSIVTSEDYKIHVEYANNVILSFIREPSHHQSHSRIRSTNKAILSDYTSTNEGDESIIVYSQVDSSQGQSINPLLSFRIGKTIKEGKILPVHNKVLKHENSIPENEAKGVTNHTIPYNLRYPTGGLFGQNIVITGFLPNDNDISVFIYNKPTGKWSRLNFFCDHDYGSHRCWGGFAWQSHHKVVLLGNYLTSRTTCSIRFFTLMVTVSLPITNILASLELEGGHYHCPDGTKVFYKDDNSSTDDNNRDKLSEEEAAYSSSDALSDVEKKIMDKLHRRSSVSASSDKVPQSISFSEYVHYVAPKTKFTTIRSVFPPAAITLGRNAMDRYGDLISDFEFVSCNGDRIPVSLRILMERWGRYFIQLLAKGYINAVDRFERDQEVENNSARNEALSDRRNSSSKIHNKLRSSMSTGAGSSISSSNSEVSVNQNSASKKGHPPTYHISFPAPSSKYPKEPPQFRLPFQDSSIANDSIPEKIQNESMSPPSKETSTETETNNSNEIHDSSASPNIIDKQNELSRKESVSSFASNNSLLNSHLQNIPPQLPLPSEPIPTVPASTSFRSSSRKNSADLSSPRASLMYTLTALRNIPLSKSPRDSPFSSPRASVSGPVAAPMGNELLNSAIPNLKQGSLSVNRNSHHLSRSLDSSPSSSTDALPLKSSTTEALMDDISRNKKVSSSSSIASLDLFSQDRRFSPLTPIQQDSNKASSKDEHNQDYEERNNDSLFNNPLLDFENIESGKFRMEPSLIPRKLYMPFGTSSIKAFCEYLYTGQVGNKWLLSPVTLDNLAISKFLDVPLLYDLISEVLFGVIGRKESFIIREGNKLKKRYNELLNLTGSVKDSTLKFPLDEYEGFMDTIDDGFLDITLLKKSSASHKDSSASAMSSKKNKLSFNSASSFRYSISIDDINENSMSLTEVPIGETTSTKIPYNQEKNMPSTTQDQLTDDSIDKSTSNSEEDNDFEVGYLDARDNLSFNVGPRAKSIFDKSGAEMQFQSALDQELKDKESELEKSRSLSLTLEQLVSPQSPLPSDYTIDLIYESATLCRDIKLMLRSANVKNMGEVFNQSKLELNMAIEELENMYDEQQKRKNDNQKVESSQPKGKMALLMSGNESDTGLEHIRSNMSSSSLSTIGLRSVDLEKSKSNTGFRNFGPFKSKTDLKMSKINSFDSNKELDRRITRLIKNDEKLKLKTAKDEKLRRLQDQKLERKQTDKPKLVSRKSLFTKFKEEGSSSTLASETSTNKKRHGLLHHLSHHRKKNETTNQGDDSLLEYSNLSRTVSASGSISSSNSKKSQGLRIKNGLFGKKRSSN